MDFVVSDVVGLPIKHEFFLVLLSILVAIVAAYTALHVASRIGTSQGAIRLGWIAAASVAMGGGIWSMHFIAMMAFMLPISIGYDTSTTLLSLATAIGMTGVGLTINNIRGAGRGLLILSGTVMGAGIASMHYTGMAAMRMDADILYRPVYVLAALSIAIVASTVALYLSSKERALWRKVVAAPVMGAAISGMHYVAMAGTICVATPSAIVGRISAAPQVELAIEVAVGTAVIMGIGLMSAAVDRKFAHVSAQQAELLKRSERRLRALLENASDRIFLLDDRGRVHYAVGLEYGSFGGECIGRQFEDLVADTHRAAIVEVLNAVKHTGHCGPLDTRIPDAFGRYRDFELRGTDLRADPAVQGIVITLHDITERKRASDQVRHAMELSEQASRMKSQFIATMSHELRTPLNAIIGFSEIMETETFGPIGNSRYSGYAENILTSGRHLLGVVNNILDISKIEAGELDLSEDWIDLERFLADCVNLAVSEVSGREVHIDCVPDDVSIRLFGDEQKLRQILVNLLSNGLKFSHEGEVVTIQVESLQEGSIAIAVVDHGEGIPEQEIENVRQPFVQADGSISRRHEGSGLGLAIACGFASLHDAEIDLQSRIGEGTRATLILPNWRVSMSRHDIKAEQEGAVS